MSTVDASIPLQGQLPKLMTPFEAQSGALNLKQLQQNTQMGNMELQKNMLALKDQQELSGLWSNKDNINPETGMLKREAYSKLSNPMLVQKAMAADTEAQYKKQQLALETGKAAVEANKAKQTAVHDMYEDAYAKYADMKSKGIDEKTATEAFNKAQMEGISGLKTSGVFDKEWNPPMLPPSEAGKRLLSYKERAEMDMRKKTQDRSDQRETEMERHNRASEERLASIAARTGEGGKAPSGYRKTSEGNLEFIPGGPADPKTKEGKLGSREQVYLQRTMTSANEAAKDLENVVQLPMTASTGWLGGRQQGTSLFGATKEVLANKMTPQEVQSYGVLSSGFQRALAGIEASGLAPPGSLSHQMDAVIFKEGDTNMTKLQKLAQTRQIVEAGLESTLANPRIPEDQRKHIEGIIKSIGKSVPFTQSDLLRLDIEQAKNPHATLESTMKKMKKTDNVAADAGNSVTAPGGKVYHFKDAAAAEAFKKAAGIQ